MSRIPGKAAPTQGIFKTMTRATTYKGFTLIELLIAVLIIGILAAIALPALNKQRERAKDSAAQQSLEAGLRAAKAVYAEGESFPASGVGTLLGRAERSQSFAEASAFPAAGANTINVERRSASELVLRSVSASGNQHMLRLEEPDSRVTRYGPQATGTGASGTLAQAVNLAPNPSFEVNLSNVGSGNAGVGVRSSAWASSGSWSYYYTGTSSTPSSAGSYPRDGSTAFGRLPISAGQSYLWRVSSRVLTTMGLGVRACIEWYDTNNASINTPCSPYWTGTGEREWELLSVAPSNAVYATPTLYMGVPGSGCPCSWEFYVDSMLFAASSRGMSYFDGGSPGASWSATAHNSPSTGPVGASSW